jgi:hypothetical protein
MSDQQKHAEASGFGNNCGFHCFISSFLALDKKTIKNIIKNKSYKENFILLKNSFIEFYDLGKELSLMDIINFTKKMPVKDQQIMWGPVLRNVALELTSNNNKKDPLIKEIKNSDFISDDTLSLMAKSFGAKVSITKQNLTYSLEATNAGVWDLKLHHSGAHWDFDYPEPKQNLAHNLDFNKTKSLLKFENINQLKYSVKNKIESLELENNIASIETARTLAHDMGGVAVLWQAIGLAKPVPKTEEDALKKIVQQQMEIEKGINKPSNKKS